MIDYSKFGFLPYQIKWLTDDSQVKLCEKSRRVGMTYVQAFEDVIDAGIEGRCDVWFSSNNETNAREYIDYCKKFAKTLNLVLQVVDNTTILDDSDAQTFVLRFKNGKKITGLSSSPNQIHGKGGKIVLDEFARRDNEADVWEAASPAALVWEHPIRIISTHKGKQSLFHSFIERLKRGELKWSHHKTTFPEAVRQGLADKALRKKCTKEEQDAYIDKIKGSVGDPSIWAQQFLCEPQDENETFIPYMMLEKAAKAELLPFEDLKKCRVLYAGLDVARKINFSLLYIIEEVTPSLFVTRHIMAVQGESFVKQNKVFSKIIADLPTLRRVCIDQTGMGIGLTDFLQDKWGSRIEGVTFTATNKEVMGFRLKRQLGDGSFMIPYDTVIFDDFQLVKQDITATGNIRLSAGTKDDSHADRFWGAALAAEAASGDEYVKPEVHTMPSARAQRIDKMLQGFSKE